MKIHTNFSFREDIYSYTGTATSQILHAMIGISYPDTGYQIMRKNADNYSIEYVYQGSGTIYENNNTFQVNAGDFFILHPNTNHYYYAAPDNPWKKIWLVVNGDTHFISALLNLYKIRDKIYFPKINDPLELENIFQLLQKDTPETTNELEHRVFLLIQKLSHIKSSVNNENVSSTIMQAKAYIDEKIKTRITVEEISNLFFISPTYFSRAFKEAYGISPSQYILLGKINLAKVLLEKTPLTLQEISDQLSFFDAAHFSNSFKKIYGISPKEYRKNFSTKTIK